MIMKCDTNNDSTYLKMLFNLKHYGVFEERIEKKFSFMVQSFHSDRPSFLLVTSDHLYKDNRTSTH